MYRRGRPGPFEILGLLAYCKSGNASIEISLPDDRLRVTFRFDDGPSGWAESVVRDCAIPAVYSFGRIEFVSHATLLRIDAPQFLQLDPACTVATASQIGKSEQEHLTI